MGSSEIEGRKAECSSEAVSVRHLRAMRQWSVRRRSVRQWAVTQWAAVRQRLVQEAGVRKCKKVRKILVSQWAEVSQ